MSFSATPVEAVSIVCAAPSTVKGDGRAQMVTGRQRSALSGVERIENIRSLRQDQPTEAGRAPLKRLGSPAHGAGSLASSASVASRSMGARL